MIELILNTLLTLLLLYKYEALFVIGFIAAFAIPIPASTTLAAAGAFASQGYLEIRAVLAVAFAANIAGDLAGYFLARRYGARVLKHLGFVHIMASVRYRALKKYVLLVPQSLIYFTRFLTEAGPTVNVLSGLMGVPTRIFIMFDVLGEASYVLTYGLAGYYLGTQWENDISFFTKGGVLLLSIGFCVMLIQTFIYSRYK